MLTISEAAGALLAQMLVQAKASDTVAVRFVPDGNSLSMQLDDVRADDVTFEHETRTVLALDAEVSDALVDRTLDVNDAHDVPQLMLQ